MRWPPEFDRPVVIFSCQVFQHWLKQLRPPDWVRYLTFHDYGLHAVPKNLRQTIQNAIDTLKQPGLIVLGYGLCGNGLEKYADSDSYLRN